MDTPRDAPTDSQRWVAQRATPIMVVMAVLAVVGAAWGVSLWRGGSTWGAITLAVLVVVLVFQVVSTGEIAKHVAAQDSQPRGRR
ncbi:hypothetical protein [Corynebacterium sp.]|uniref:hypothetical protein n=1 Tax=Corynebacterium sp. TaxID=1720 RepID=UPI0026499B40|nr:hypothetical protein [Corynebacterium sp.]MDN5721114.1 hypothetical protein [Corynebacterium sp.]